LKSNYLYLAVDLAVIAVPFAASFYPKAPFYREWKKAGIALLITASFFIAWDELFTRIGIWNFNERYITGMYIGSLPVEEVLFFICIPYACIFTYFALNRLVMTDILYRHQGLISTMLIVVLVLTGVALFDRIYTATTCAMLALFLTLQKTLIKSAYMGRFYVSYVVLLVPFFVVNGILTGFFTEEPVVRYNDAHNLRIRIGTIPVEDMFYGMLMMAMPVAIMERLSGGSTYKRQVRG
jgi:lycopene cyclase domain-containing protein